MCYIFKIFCPAFPILKQVPKFTLKFKNFSYLNLPIMLQMTESSMGAPCPHRSEFSYLFQWRYAQSVERFNAPVSNGFPLFFFTKKPQGIQSIQQSPNCVRQVAQNMNNVFVSERAMGHILTCALFLLI